MGAAKKLIVVAGARPNFIKVAPLMRQLSKQQERLSACLVHTGQHYDIEMSQAFFAELGIPEPDINFGVGSASHAVQTASIMVEFEKVCEARRPDWVVVVGDVNSTLACALVASKVGVQVAHVEAGLRSFDRTMPEEINRLVTDVLADLLFTPSRDADENLAREGVDAAKIRLVGNIMIDTLVANLDRAHQSTIAAKYGLKSRDFVYVTLHRPSNVDDRRVATAIMKQLNDLARAIPVFFPLHPRTQRMLSTFGLLGESDDRLKLVDPVGYLDSLWLAENARVVLTDSGGLQEETTFFRTPCLTLRPNTERPITVSEGSNRLTTPDRLLADTEDRLGGPERIGRCPSLWDGKTAQRIVDEFSGKDSL